MTTAASLPDDVLQLEPGQYDVLVHADTAEDPEIVTVSLTRLPE